MTGLDRVMQDIVREAGAMLKSAHLSTSEIHEKEGPANFCTDYDLRIQRFIMGRLAEAAPGCSSFGEEDTEGNHGSATSPIPFTLTPLTARPTSCSITITAACRWVWPMQGS